MWAKAMQYQITNRLLKALPKHELMRVTSNAELTELKAGELIYESGRIERYAYFPTTAIIALMYSGEGSACSEVITIGAEGMLGISLILTNKVSFGSAQVQYGGYAYRVPGDHLKHEFHRHGAFMQLLLRYTQTLIIQLAQISVCAIHHSLLQQLCRYLLENSRHNENAEQLVTQQYIANTLGTRRERVTAIAGYLQRSGLIEYSRGKLTITDHTGLEKLACDCHRIIQNEYERLTTGLKPKG